MPTEAILPEEELQELVRQCIKGGRLPVMRPDQIIAGYGSRKACAVCNNSIDRRKVEYEVRPDKIRALVFHFSCYVVWQRECSRLMGAPAQSYEDLRRGTGPEKPDDPWSTRDAHLLFA